MQCEIIDTGKRRAAENMELDRALLGDLEHTPVMLLHLYDWELPSATYGCFVDPAKFLRKEAPIDLAKRPTGGGILFHTTDYAFSVLVPKGHPNYSENTLENYAFINRKVITALGGGELLAVEAEPLDAACRHFCMSKPTRYDVMLNGKKVGGAAQRRTKHGYLHQGSLFLEPLSPSFLEATLLPGMRVAEAMAHNSTPLRMRRDEVKRRLIEVFTA